MANNVARNTTEQAEISSSERMSMNCPNEKET
jgi:hypothetical protein